MGILYLLDGSLTRSLSESVFLSMLVYQHLYLKLENEKEGGEQSGIQITTVSNATSIILTTTVQHKHECTTSTQSKLLPNLG